MQHSHVIGVVCMMVCMVSALFAGCTSSAPSDSGSTQTVSPASSTSATQDDLTLVESHLAAGDDGETYVAGTIRSNVDRQLSHVEVTIAEDHSSGAQVGSTMDNMNDLEPYGTWKFKAPVLDNDATRFKVTQITGR